MATAKKQKTESFTSQEIIEAYMNTVLETESYPKSVYKFCKENKIPETDFFKNFGSFEGLHEEIWNAFFDNALQALNGNEDFASYSNKDKLLAFYYTFFEVLTLNRSFVLFVLPERPSSLKEVGFLKGLRSRVKQFASTLIEDGNAEKNLKITRHSVTIFSEAAWVHMLFLLSFWRKDTSAGMEKTDVAIEKSVRAVFDVFDTTPLDSVVDLGKFLFKELRA